MYCKGNIVIVYNDNKKRHKRIKKMAERRLHRLLLAKISFFKVQLSLRYTRAFRKEILNFHSRYFSKLLIVDTSYEIALENAEV